MNKMKCSKYTQQNPIHKEEWNTVICRNMNAMEIIMLSEMSKVQKSNILWIQSPTKSKEKLTEKIFGVKLSSLETVEKGRCTSKY